MTWRSRELARVMGSLPADDRKKGDASREASLDSS